QQGGDLSKAYGVEVVQKQVPAGPEVQLLGTDRLPGGNKGVPADVNHGGDRGWPERDEPTGRAPALRLSVYFEHCPRAQDSIRTVAQHNPFRPQYHLAAAQPVPEKSDADQGRPNKERNEEQILCVCWGR